MILIYRGVLKHISCQMFKKLQNKSHGISPPLLFSLMTPYLNETPKFHLIYIKICVKDVEMITQKRLVQFIEKKSYFKNLRGCWPILSIRANGLFFFSKYLKVSESTLRPSPALVVMGVPYMTLLFNSVN